MSENSTPGGERYQAADAEVYQRPAPPRLWGAISWLRDLAFSVLIAVVLIVFIYQPVKVEGTSMLPTLSDQERIFISKFSYEFGLADIQHGDTVVFWFPLDTSKSYIKRVIGLPGDRVRVDRDGKSDKMRFERTPEKKPAAAATK